MQKFKNIIITIFAFIIPAFLILDVLLLQGYWVVEYKGYEGETMRAQVSGLPFPSVFATSKQHISLFPFLLNGLIKFLLTIIVYQFLLKKINIVTDTQKIMQSVILTFTYVAFGLIRGFLFFHYGNLDITTSFEYTEIINFNWLWFSIP